MDIGDLPNLNPKFLFNFKIFNLFKLKYVKIYINNKKEKIIIINI